ncbi:MAG TPA: ABC transporter permease, partial [Thermomicrobiales bacterium]|nr:ABC transporter permease [Thermomicrobiales bacterium]
MSAIEQDRAAPVLATRQPGALSRFLLPVIRHEEIALFGLFLLVAAFFAVAVPSARTSGTYLDLLRDVSPNLIAAIGVTLLLLSGEFDLSVGAMLAFTGVVTVSTFNATDNMWMGIIAGLLTGPLIGAINGYLVTVQGMSSLMTTLGTMFALRGLVYVWTNKTPVIDENGFTAFTQLYQGEIFGAPTPGLIAIVLIALAFVLLTRTEFGRYI